jgi:hypothetical protein
LERHAGVDAKTAAWAARLGHGSVGRALGFLSVDDEKGALEKLRRRAWEIVAAATAPEAAEGYALALGFPPAGARGLVHLFAFVEEWLRDLAAVATGARDRVLNLDEVETLRRVAERSALASFDIARAFACVERARELAYGNVNPQLVVFGLVRDLRAELSRPATAGVGS